MLQGGNVSWALSEMHISHVAMQFSNLTECHILFFVFAEHVQGKETVYVHCKAGRGRSTTVVLCYLVCCPVYVLFLW